ncbi:TonB-dependent receptor plug domain-containing protein [Shewanella putrefaciens]|uniref:TonB-dependent receptor n=2 Tax=Shewanella putrefaciens TaxID=24 RepID=A4YAC0_SHEPC|nr:TonB-dependent receptor [Shewanella putrefaciens]CAD6364950.1 Vitamin B12 transporter BtuB [Shewanella hafniensis]AVV85343.1 TonB-denpendent receptor [Shewanella putrefaciens]MCA1897543.1 TonB-dependent receptor [Shewanella putrefaciens]MCT8942960.1 TonB-dependent receptor [Shewanella putrefaciens]QGS48734.1 TonB-dependent receptor plug domain-containing protein [Shewanella putrefaciens]
MKPTYLATILAILLSPQLVVAEEVDSAETANIERMSVIGVRQRLEQAGTLANTIMKTEVINATTIENKNAVNLSEAIDNSPGVKVSNECSMCGVKRIMLNGMKGEQTTILVDGLPVHTMISGYYAVDAIPTTGIERIEVARGAGASLIAPEAIGGTINIISYEPTENGAELDVSAGENGYRKMGFLGKGVSEDGRTRATLVAQYDDRDQFDADHNKVNEAPQQENRSLTARVSQDVTDTDNLVLRIANIQSEIFGGPMLGSTFADGTASSIGNVLSGFDDQFSEPQQLFEDGDVRKPFTGKAWETTEWIKTERNEASLAWLKEFSDDWNMHLAASYAEHKQDSFYEGFDYTAEDKMWFFDARFNYLLTENQLLTFGADLRTEEMRSHSRAGSANPNYASDSFDYDVKGVYIQDTWQATEALEIAMALRYDTITADFTDPNKPGTELDESILSPRLDVRLRHNDEWTSRVSAGRGYRAPLSFFETDHGILDGSLGFDIDIDELERSNSASYALSYEGEKLTSTASIAWTEVEHLAALTTNDLGIPLLTQLDEKATVITSDIALGYRLTDDMTLSLTAEHFDYDSVFKSSYAIAPIEERLTLTFDWDVNDWEFFANVVWVGSRDLSKYGYEGYNRLDANGQVDPDSKKTTDAPSYLTVDLRVSYQLNEYLSLYSGVSNLFDYTQAGDEETPLFYDAEGAFDVGYIYGPLRGREIYAGMKLAF